MDVVALAGGIGAARFLRGLVRVVAPAQLTVVGNTGDDLQLHGLHLSPDLDTITYTLGGGVHPEQGWGRADERFTVAQELQERYGQAAWFTLGDRDLATHLFRTGLLRSGATLSEATARIAQRWGLRFRLVPMTDDAVETRIRTADGRVLHFQQWWVGEQARPDVAAVWLERAEQARPAPGVLEWLERTDAVVLCPSNPVVSIGPILSVPGVRDVLRQRKAQRRPVVGVSPIVGGRVVRGMADRLLPAVGADTSAAGVARLFTDVLTGWVLDEQDAQAVDDVASLGIVPAVTNTLMHRVEVAESVARTALQLVR